MKPKSGGNIQHKLEPHLLKFDEVGRLDPSVKLTSRFGELEKQKEDHSVYEGQQEFNTTEGRLAKQLATL